MAYGSGRRDRANGGTADQPVAAGPRPARLTARAGAAREGYPDTPCNLVQDYLVGECGVLKLHRIS